MPRPALGIALEQIKPTVELRLLGWRQGIVFDARRDRVPNVFCQLDSFDDAEFANFVQIEHRNILRRAGSRGKDGLAAGLINYSPFSSRSASTRKANAFTFEIASARVCP